MKKQKILGLIKKNKIVSLLAFCLLLIITNIQSSKNLVANMLYSKQAREVATDANIDLEVDFNLWYIENSDQNKNWTIPSINNIAELPLGIVDNNNSENTMPIDSVEFQLINVPDFLEWVNTTTFEGFHVDTHIKDGNIKDTKNISIYVAPETFSGSGIDANNGNPNEIGDLIKGASEILRLNFKVIKDPSSYNNLAFSINAILTARDGNFTRYKLGTRLSNIGTINIETVQSGQPQIVYTTALDEKSVALDFNVHTLEGSGINSSERADNYIIYKCGANIPAPVSNDPNADDAKSCRNMTQGSIESPWVPVSAQTMQTSKKLKLTSQNKEFIEGVYYIVLVSNIADETGRIENSMPEEGVFSQMFQWNTHPRVINIASLNENQVRVVFSENVCPASDLQELSAKNINNYKLFACNEDSDIENCIKKNEKDVENLEINKLEFDNKKTVILHTSTQIPESWYILKVSNVANENCDVKTKNPGMNDEPYYTNQFQGFTEQLGKLNIGISDGDKFYLPWRGKMFLNATGGAGPYIWQVIPEDAGTIDFSNPEHIIFQPKLKNDNNQAIHEERDIKIKVTDVFGESYEIPLQILRRGDLGGEGARFLNRTDTVDLNDVSAGWRR